MKVKKGQIWFAKRPCAQTLIKCKITCITKHTVEILAITDYRTWPERYKKDEIEFVELCEPLASEDDIEIPDYLRRNND